MKKFFTACVISLIAISTPTQNLFAESTGVQLTPEQMEMMLERSVAIMKENQKDDCNDPEALQCIGISKSTCETTTKEIMNNCTIPVLKKFISEGKFGADITRKIEMESAQCAIKVAAKNKVDPKKFLVCSGEGSYDDDSIIRELIEKS